MVLRIATLMLGIRDFDFHSEVLQHQEHRIRMGKGYNVHGHTYTLYQTDGAVAEVCQCQAYGLAAPQ